MTVRTYAIERAYCATEALSRVATPVYPARWHAGHRACSAVRGMGCLPGPATASFARRVLVSRWRCALLLAQLKGLSTEELLLFLETKVCREGQAPTELLGPGSRPMILVTPHYGACVAGCVAAAYWLRNSRPLAVYYELTERNTGISQLLSRAGARVSALDAGFTGVRRAAKTLQAGGCVAMMPDIYLDVSATVAIPFFGRWLRAPTGTAYLAMRWDALVVPAYAVAGERMNVVVRFSDAIDPRSVRSGDDAQDRFMLTCLIFADIERTLRRAPEHWLHWERLPAISRALALPDSFSRVDMAAALAARCRRFPGLTRRVPELFTALQSHLRSASSGEASRHSGRAVGGPGVGLCGGAVRSGALGGILQ